MHRARRLARRRSAIALAALVLGAGSLSEGASLVSSIRYGTTGTVSSGDASGPNLVRFVGVDGMTATTATPYKAGEIPAMIAGDRGSPLDLGHFEVAPPASGSTTVYDNTPFAITVQVQSVDGSSAAAGLGSMVIHGWLDGTVGGSGPASLMAHYQLAGAYGLPWEPSNDVGSFETGLVNQTLTIPGFATALTVPTGSASSTELTGVLVGDTPLPSPAPEPGTLLIFGAAGIGLALRVRARSRIART